MKLVLVEGFPGSGKSTTAQWLALEWQRQGRPARWIYEQQPGHPVCGLSPGGEEQTWDEFFEQRTAQWVEFAARVEASDELLILESALLQYPVFVMLRHGAEPETIVRFIQRIAGVIRPLAPRLVQFLTPDPEAAYRAITARRGRALIPALLPRYEETQFFQRRGLRGFEGLLAYWREHSALCDRAVAALDIDTLIVDSRQGDWPWRRRQIAKFLGLPEIDHEEARLADPQRYVGRYRVQWRGAIRECSVELEDGQLVLDGLLWPRNRLLWRERSVFHAEAWPFEVVFEEGPDGAIEGLTLRA